MTGPEWPVATRLGLDPECVAVELNRRLVRRIQGEATAVEDGASLETVTFVGGG